jgi:hypothetical protein
MVIAAPPNLAVLLIKLLPAMQELLIYILGFYGSVILVSELEKLPISYFYACE